MARREVAEQQFEALVVDDAMLGTDGSAFDEARPDGRDAPALAALPLFRPASGLYTHSPIALPPVPQPTHALPTLPILVREELRLDVDGRYPQMVASGTLFLRLQARMHWIANLTATAPDTYAGAIWYTDGDTNLLPYTSVSIQVRRSFFPNLRTATVTFSAAGKTDRVRTYRFSSASFHPVELEYDTVAGTTAVTSINTGNHPNRPAALAVEDLSIETVYRRAGFRVTTGTHSAVPMTAAGADALWSDMEMHDAMQVHWSRFADKPQWAVWTLFAGQHVAVPSQGITPTNLGGIMFDDIGPNHRQGTAVFNGSFICNIPTGDPAPAASVDRIKFWTAVHELGHTFNLAHAWQKSLGAPWIPLTDEPEARSFMNYPYRVQGGEAAFFADFEFRFSDDELIFMRHAPERFVQHGNADWFDDHGFEGAAVLPYSQFSLEVRVHRSVGSVFEFLEPVVVELKLTNVSQRSCVIDANALSQIENLAVIIKRHGAAARQWTPYARYCLDGDQLVLQPGDSLYGSLSIAAGLNGWDIAEPGMYEVCVVLRQGEEDIVSNALGIRILPPQGRDEEYIAQEFFSEEVGRALAFGGTRAMEDAIDTLQTVADQLPERRVAKHAQLALGNALAQRYKLLDIGDDPDSARIVLKSAKPEEAQANLTNALAAEPEKSADTLGHIDYAQHVVDRASQLAQEGEAAEASSSLATAAELLAARGVLPTVVADLSDEQAKYATKRKAPAKRAAKRNK
ncbi:MAG TPA: hypothetical protein VIQ02_15045 [Jiangellaceae bacterium]